MVAHLEAVTSLAVDPNGLYLMSGSKYINYGLFIYPYFFHVNVIFPFNFFFFSSSFFSFLLIQVMTVQYVYGT